MGDVGQLEVADRLTTLQHQIAEGGTVVGGVDLAALERRVFSRSRSHASQYTSTQRRRGRGGT